MCTPDTILEDLLREWPALMPLGDSIREAYALLCQCYDRGGMVLCCGNGGSAADAEHIVGELMKAFLRRRPLPQDIAARFTAPSQQAMASSLQAALPAISLVSQSALISAYANDVDPGMVYAQQVLGYGRCCPILLLALSTSGNSANVVHAVEAADCLGMPSIAITGANGGKLAGLCTVCLRMPAAETYRVQEYSLPVYHALCAMTEAHYFPD